MHSTLIELFQSSACTLVFALYLLPCGFLTAYAANIQDFRERSNTERMLWTLAFSLPVALVLAELLGRILPNAAVQAIFFVLALLAILLALRHKQPSRPWPREQRLIAIAVIVLVAYLLLTLLDIQVGNKLFVPTTFTDWGVRIPLTWSAIRGPVPPLNPLSALEGHPAPLRYYYFWYVLCAQPARLLHASPDAALAASSVWAAFALLAISFLLLKYFVRSDAPLQRRCLLLLLAMLVIGLDILPTLGTYLHHGSNPYLDIEWWHDDRTPGLLTALLYAPHHIAGLVCCFAAYLSLVVDPSEARTHTSTLATNIPRALIAGICFAACVGTSTFIAFIFVLAGFFWTIDLIRTKQWPPLGTLAGSGIIAYAISRVYLHELKSSSSAAHGFAGFAWRSNAYVNMSFSRHAFFVTHHAIALIAKQPFILALDFAELGFFAFVAAHQLRHQLIPALRGEYKMTSGERALWAIFFATALCWLFISSGAATLSGNDLGSHAGMLTRFVLVLWSPNYLLYLRERYLASQKRRLAPQLAVLCLVLGLAGGLFDAVWHRVYVPLFAAHILPAPAGDFASPDHLSERLLNIRTVWRSLDVLLPADAIVQSNPLGAMRIATTRYSMRQLAASDDGCGTAFGGDHDLCTPVRATLRHLYDEENQTINLAGEEIPAVPESIATVDDFRATCRSLHLAAILVDQTDHVWNQSGSWVWNMQPIASAPTIRAYACPAS